MKLLFIFLLLFPAVSLADGTVNFTWTAPTERTDNTPLPSSEIGGYRIYGNDQIIDVVGAVTTASVDYIGRGKTEFRLQTYDTDGLESALSEAVFVNLSAPPKKPVNFNGKK